jgi:MraZ protein
MSEAFRGEFYQKVDSKARVSVPAAFRRIIEAGDSGFSAPDPGPARARFIIVYGGAQSYLECYTLEGMKRIERQIARMQPGSPQRKYLERNMLTRSLVAEIDDDGRIVLSQKLREKIGLGCEGGAESVFAGALDKFQVWNRPAYDAQAAEEDEFELPPGADMAALLPFEPED